MSSVFAPTDAIYLLFRTLTHQALEQHPDAPDSLAIGSYNYRPVEGGFVIRLYSSKANHPFEVGYLPKLAREKKGTIAQFVSANAQQPRLFEPSSPDTTREYLKTLLWACDHDREGLVDVKLPDDEDETATLTLPSQATEASPPSMAREPNTLSTAAVPVSFEALAEDILSGKPQPFQTEAKHCDMYEVWGSRLDEVACVVVRHFDFGTALAVAALVPGSMHNQIDFDEAAYLLIQSLIDPATQAPAAPVYKALRLLEGPETRVRLQAALELCRAETGLAYEPGLTGFPSADTLAYLKTFDHLPSSTQPLDEELGDTPDFERMARLRLLIKKTYEWTADREAAELPRIELLSHLNFTGGLVLVQIEPKTDELYVSVFCPAAWDHSLHDAFLEEVRDLGIARKFDTSTPATLSPASPFKHVPTARAEAILRGFSDDAEAQEGCYHDLDPIDFAAPAPLAGERTLSAVATTEEDFTALTRPRGATLH